MRKIYLGIFLLISFSFPLFADHAFNWESLPVPVAGLEGAFTGMHDDIIIWGGGRQEATLHKDLYIYRNSDWRLAGQLPFPLLKELSLSTPHGAVSIEGRQQRVLLLQWNEPKEQIDLINLPDLPEPLINLAGAFINGRIYVAGLQEPGHKPAFYVLNPRLLEGLASEQWEKLPAWPLELSAILVAVGQSDGVDNGLFLFGHTGGNRQLRGVYYNPRQKQWTRLADGPVIDPSEKLPAAAFGSGHILFFSAGHIYSFYTITGSWAKVGSIPEPLSAKAVFALKDHFLIAGQGNLYQLKPFVKQHAFGWINYLVLFFYFVILLWMGWHFSRRQLSTDDYFKGGGRVPWWAAGLSIFGTILSAISFMAIPAKTFATDWSYLIYNFSPFFIAPFVILLFLPFYHRLKLTTAYEYLEHRFNLTVRLLGSLAFMLFQLGRIAIVLYLPAIALNIVTGFDIILCITLMGVVSIIYTVLGGIEGVIWTDVLQVLVLMGGAILCLFLIISSLEGGAVELYQTAKAHHKFNILDFNPTLQEPTFWVVLLGGVFSNLIFYGTDQTVVQRYVTAKDIKSARKSVWTNGILVIPATVLFFTIGTALYAFYQSKPESLQMGMMATDAVFPWYIISQLPQGVSGLLIAGIFAASMSSLSSSFNSVASTYTTDIHQRFNWQADDLYIARLATLIVGLAGTGFAIWLANSDVKSLWDEFLRIIGLVTGGLGAVFLLGIMTKRANSAGAIIGLIGSAIVQYWVASTAPVHLLLYTTTGMISCLVIGYVASLLYRGS